MHWLLTSFLKRKVENAGKLTRANESSFQQKTPPLRNFPSRNVLESNKIFDFITQILFAMSSILNFGSQKNFSY